MAPFLYTYDYRNRLTRVESKTCPFYEAGLVKANSIGSGFSLLFRMSRWRFRAFRLALQSDDILAFFGRSIRRFFSDS